MGDLRFREPYERLRQAADRGRTLYALEDEEVVMALAQASREKDPLLANVLATEAMNRMRRSRTAMAHLAEGVIACDAQGRITSLNPTARRLLGYGREDVLGRDVHETLLHQDEHGRPIPRERCALLDVLRSRTPVEREGEAFTRKDGTPFVVEYVAAPILREGEVHGLVAAFRDVTDRKRAQRELRFQKGLLEAQAEATPDGLLVVDPHGRMVSHNRRFQEIWEFPPEVLASGDDEVALRHAASRTSDPEGFLRRVHEVYRERPALARDEVRLRDGMILDRLGTTVRGPGGETYGWLWIFRDVTDRRRAEAQVERERTRYRTLYESSPFMHVTADAAGLILDVNAAMVLHMGYAREEMVGRPLQDLYAPGSKEAVARALEEVVAHGGVRQAEADKLRKDGTILHVRDTTTRIGGPNGEVLVLVVCEDLTARQAADEARARTEARLGSVVESLAEGIVVVGSDERVLLANRAAERILGLRREEMAGRAYDAHHDGAWPRAYDGTPLPVEEWPLTRALRERREVRDARVAVDHPVTGRRYLLLNAVPVPGDGAVVTFTDVTGKIHAERALEAQTEIHEALLRAQGEMGDAVVLSDGARVLYANDAFLRFTGYSEDELRALPSLLDLLPPESREEAGERLRRRLDGEPMPQHYETVFLTKGGDRRLLELAVRATTSGGRRLLVMVGRDVTARAAAEERYRLLVEGAKDTAIFMLDPRGHIMSWNPGAQRMKGYEEHEILGKHFSVFYTPEDIARDHPAHELEIVSEHGTYHEEGWRVRKDGSRFWAHLTITALRDEQGALRGFAKVTRDLTDRKMAEDRLKAREQQQAAVAELGLAALGKAPLSDLFAEVARVVASRLDVEYAEVLQLDEDAPTLTFRGAFGWGPPVEPGRTRLGAGEDGHPGHALAASAPVVVDDLATDPRLHGPSLFVEGGVVSGAMAIVHGARGPWGVLGAHARRRRAFSQDDVNFLQSVANVLSNAIQRREAEEEMEARVRDRTAQLHQAVTDLETFTNSASHDLRAPLRGVEALLEVLAEDVAPKLDPAEADLLARVRRESHKASKLVHDMLAFARSTRQEVDLRDVDVTALAREVAREVSQRHPKRGTRWEVAEGMRARADPGLLRIALDNLMSNASKYSAKADKPLVRVDAREEDGRRVFEVRDNGVGFPQQEAYRLFQPFHRLSTATGYEGTGLGLATVHRIVARHGGRIWAESAPGRGSVFRFTLDGEREGE